MNRGRYTSLRQFGKYNHLTVLGSVFDAEDLVKVAKGENSRYAGQFDGRVVDVTTVDAFSSVIKALLEWECPIIVPYDVSVANDTKGEPTNRRGEAAHWAAIIGHYTVGADDYVVYFNWGGFYTARMRAFAVSNGQLTSNRYLTFAKYRITDQYGRVLHSDYDRRKGVRSQIRSWQASIDSNPNDDRQLKLDRIGKKVHNPEFTDPESTDKKCLLDNMDGRSRLFVGGLRSKVVAVFRQQDAVDIADVLKGF